MTTLQKTVVLDVVALTRDLISEQHTPFLAHYISQGGQDITKVCFLATYCSV